MRLGTGTTAVIEEMVTKALSSPCVMKVPAPRRQARRIFEGATGVVERMGGQPAPRDLLWQLPNGSQIILDVSA